MESKYSSEIQEEIDDIVKKIPFKIFFLVNVDFYIDGWAIFLREKNLYPRRLVIFKSYASESYSIKSFEIKIDNLEKEDYIELYFKEDIANSDLLIKELREIIYGKDIINFTSNKYKSYMS